jgi:transposase
VPPVHIPRRQVRQWRATIQQRRGIVNRIVSVKNRIRAVLRANGLARPKPKQNDQAVNPQNN